MLRMSPPITRRTLAENFATHHHRDDKRDTGEPYVTHPIGVADIIAFLLGPKTQHLQVVGVLHDTHEMCSEVTQKLLRKTFGRTVAADVESLTRKQGLTHEERRDWLWKTPRSRNACIVMAADKIYNLRTIPAHWDIGRKQGYLMKVRENYQYLGTRRIPPILLDTLEGAYNTIAASIDMPMLDHHLRAGGWLPGRRHKGRSVNYDAAVLPQPACS